MKKSTLLVIVFFVGITLFVLRISADKKKQQQNNQSSTAAETETVVFQEGTAYLFVGEGCPHCENVEKFMDEQKTKEKLKVETLEVFENIGNQKYYTEAFKNCGKDVQQISVPVMYYNGECLSGDQDIINKMKELSL